MDRERRLPPFAEDALTVLTEAVGDVDESDGLPKADAQALLAEDDRYTESDAAHALDMSTIGGLSTTLTIKFGLRQPTSNRRSKSNTPAIARRFHS